MIDQIRREIDQQDAQIRDCLCARMELSLRMAECKRTRGERTVYRPEREAEILQRQCETVPDAQKAALAAAMRGIMGASRMLQYDRMSLWYPETVDSLLASVPIPADPSGFRVRMALDAQQLAALLNAARDRGLDVTALCFEPDGKATASFSGNVLKASVRSFLYQLAAESRELTVTEVF